MTFSNVECIWIRIMPTIFTIYKTTKGSCVQVTLPNFEHSMFGTHMIFWIGSELIRAHEVYVLNYMHREMCHCIINSIVFDGLETQFQTYFDTLSMTHHLCESKQKHSLTRTASTQYAANRSVWSLRMNKIDCWACKSLSSKFSVTYAYLILLFVVNQQIWLAFFHNSECLAELNFES